VIADRIGLQTSLTRGDYGRAWNEILLTGVSPEQVSALTVSLTLCYGVAAHGGYEIRPEKLALVKIDRSSHCHVSKVDLLIFFLQKQVIIYVIGAGISRTNV
jgi:hypothetical protein